MSNSPTQKTFSRTSQYLQPIYKKVAKLKQNLYEQQSKQAKDNLSRKFSQNIQSQGLSFQDTKVKANKILKPSLSMVKLNDQNNLNRQDVILKERELSHQYMKNNFYSTTLNFTTIAENKKIDKDKFSLTARSKSINNINFGLTKYQKKSSNFQKGKTQNSQRKKYFTAITTPESKFSFNKQKIQTNHKNKLIKGNKMVKIIGFLDRNQTSRKKQCKLSHQNNQNEEEQIDMTNFYIQNQQILPKALDSDLNFDQDNAALMLKQEKQDLDDQILRFKPIGSAKALRRNINKIKVQNQQRETTEKTKQKISIAIVVESKMTNYSNQGQKVKYLQKGNRFRQTLYKKLLKGSEVEPGQMIYVDEYKQWIPSKLLQSNKKELDTYMNLLLGQKKHQKTRKMTLQNIDIMYF